MKTIPNNRRLINNNFADMLLRHITASACMSYSASACNADHIYNHAQAANRSWKKEKQPAIKSLKNHMHPCTLKILSLLLKPDIIIIDIIIIIKMTLRKTESVTVCY